MGVTSGMFSGKATEAKALADLLRRLSFALWAGEYNQYVGALEGLLLERLVSAIRFAFGHERAGSEGALSAYWLVQVEALSCVRVIALRVGPEHLATLWPIAMAELQRVLLSPESARPALLLAACQLIDTLLAVLPDHFSPFGWIFVPSQDHRLAQGQEFSALLAPLARLQPPSSIGSRAGLLKSSSTGRRRPLLGLQTLQHASELAPFAKLLHRHIVDSALQSRGAEVDLPMLDVLLGCAFLSPEEARRELEPFQRAQAVCRQP